MNPLRRKLAVAGIFFAAVIILGYAAIYFLIRSERVRIWIQLELAQRTGYEVQIDDLRLGPWFNLIGSDVSISKNGEVLFKGEKVVVLVLPFDVFTGRIYRLSLEKPLFRISLPNLVKPSEISSPAFSVVTFNIYDGKFILETGRGEPFVLGSVFLNAKNMNIGRKTGLRLQAHLPSLNRNATLSVSGGPEEKKIRIFIDRGEGETATAPQTQKNKQANVLSASFQVKKLEDDSYEVNGSGSADKFRLGPENINGKFSSLLKLDAKFQDVLLSTDVTLSRFPSNFLPVSLPTGPISATLRGRYSTSLSNVTVETLKIVSPTGTLEGEGTVALGKDLGNLNLNLRLQDVPVNSFKPFMPGPLRDFTYTGKIAADLKVSGAYEDPVVKGLAWCDHAQFKGKKFSVSDLALKIPFEGTRSSLDVKAGQIRGKELTWGEKGETQWRVKEADLVSDALLPAKDPLRINGSFQIRGGRFSTPDGSKVGENLTVKGRLSYRHDAFDPFFSAEARVERFELLWDKFFGDFGDQKPLMTIDGSYHKKVDELRVDSFRIGLSSIGDVELKGWVRQFRAEPAFNVEVRSDGFRHGAFYDFFIRDAFKAVYPILGRIGISGKSNLMLRTQGSPGSFTVEGTLQLAESEIHERSNRWRIGPVTLKLPLKLRFPEALKEQRSETPPLGELRIDGVKTRSTTIPGIKTGLILWNNSLRFPQPIHISLFGGDSVIERLAWKDVIGAPQQLSFSLDLGNLRLLELTEVLGWYRFGGTVSGSIPEIRWGGETLRANGAITLNLLGGRAVIQGMAIENPLSPLRSIRMSVKLEELDLKQASETFQFGRISGVLSGTIEDLVVTQGQPAQFKADIQTVEKSDTSQWISVETLNKITVLSSGNEAGGVYGGLAGFFDFFRYSKLGFKATLKNDKLLLRGVERRDEKEYLVVGTLIPPTVNIISHNQEVGFGELIRRLERIRKAGGSKPPVQP